MEFSQSRKIGKHIVLDLDQTLIYTPEEISMWYEHMLEDNNIQSSKGLLSRVGKIIVPYNTKGGQSFKGVSGSTEMVFILRPGCLEFLTYCFSVFNTVNVWSAGSREYVKEIVDNVFRRIGKYPHIVWTYDELVNGIKPLSSMITVFGDQTGMNLHNTFLVDDLNYNFDMNPHNGILIPQYVPSPDMKGITASDFALYQLQMWFKSKTFITSQDVRTLRKDHIFS